mgnify:FL=1
MSRRQTYLHESFLHHPCFRSNSQQFLDLHREHHNVHNASLSEVIDQFKEILRTEPETFWPTLVEFLTSPETRLIFSLFENIPNHKTLDEIAEKMHIPDYILSLLKFLYTEHMEKLALQKKLDFMMAD